jgi:hypothetical protein
MFEWAGRVGVRQRGLRAHHANLARITNVQHRT